MTWTHVNLCRSWVENVVKASLTLLMSRRSEQPCRRGWWSPTAGQWLWTLTWRNVSEEVRLPGKSLKYISAQQFACLVKDVHTRESVSSGPDAVRQTDSVWSQWPVIDSNTPVKKLETDWRTLCCWHLDAGRPHVQPCGETPGEYYLHVWSERTIKVSAVGKWNVGASSPTAAGITASHHGHGAWQVPHYL